jgi:hypothetical protein
MISKTPQFDHALDAYFSKLELDEHGGQWRACQISKQRFYIRPEDIAFYKRIRVPLPTFCPLERSRRRLSYFNDKNLFKIPSAYSGKSIVAMYPPDTPFKIFEHQVWFSDVWDPLEYGRKWNKEKSFFEQFAVLQKDVPRPNLITDSSNVNSDYTNTSTNLKNCYLTFATLSGEDLYYFNCCDGSKDCIDCDGLWNCTTVYGSQMLFDSYQCFWCFQSRNCLDCYFLYDCRGSEHCFMSANLRNKKYCFRNEQLSKEEYEKRLAEINLGNYDELKKYKAEFEEVKQSAKRKPDRNSRSINSSGDLIDDSKNCFQCLFVFSGENIAYSMGNANYKDSYDLSGGGGGELCYEFMSVSTGGNYNVHLSHQINASRNVEYSDLCRNCHDCFGCVGLKNRSFCIFNRQYSEEEYWKTLDEIKTAMLARGEYGQFFPANAMPIPYRISLAATYPGFRDYENAANYGYDMTESPSQKNETRGEVIAVADIPADIKDVSDDIIDKVIDDTESGKQFKLAKYELNFYRLHNIALPREHPLTRLDRFREEYDFKMTTYDRSCKKCGVRIHSVYDPQKFKNVYCETCYNNEVV